MNSDELQVQRWQELKIGFNTLRDLVELLSSWNASSKISTDLQEIEELAFNLRSVADQITKTAWRDYE